MVSTVLRARFLTTSGAQEEERFFSWTGIEVRREEAELSFVVCTSDPVIESEIGNVGLAKVTSDSLGKWDRLTEITR